MTSVELLQQAESIRSDVAEKYPLAATCHIRWNYRLRTTAGRAWPARNMIELSYHLFVEKGDINQHGFRNTVLHELAHVICGPGKGHGRIWKIIARNIGCTAERCHRYQGTHNANKGRRKPRTVVSCPKCGEDMKLGPTQVKRAVMYRERYGKEMYRHKKCP